MSPTATASRRGQALELIREHPGITIPELAEMMAIKQNYLYRMLPDMVDAGELVKAGRGWHVHDDRPLEQLPAFDVNGRPDPEWENFRSRATAGDWGMPKGTYDATVLSSRMVRRHDNGEWGIRVLFRVDRLGLDGFVWRPLSKNTDDPLDLTGNQIRSLRDWAGKLGITERAPADIAAGATSIVGMKVTARISSTPVGSRASIVRAHGATSVGSAPVAETPGRSSSRAVSASPRALVDASDTVQAAQAAHQALNDALSNINALTIIAAEACYHLRDSEGWQHLGYSSLNEYLAQPELGMARATFLRLAQVWDLFHVKGGVPREQLAGAEWTKLAVTTRALTSGEVTVEDAVADAVALGKRDLEEKYRGDGRAASTGFHESVSDVIVSPLLDPERGRLLSLQIGDRHAQLDRERAVKIHGAIGDWLAASPEAT